MCPLSFLWCFWHQLSMVTGWDKSLGWVAPSLNLCGDFLTSLDKDELRKMYLRKKIYILLKYMI